MRAQSARHGVSTRIRRAIALPPGPRRQGASRAIRGKSPSAARMSAAPAISAMVRSGEGDAAGLATPRAARAEGRIECLLRLHSSGCTWWRASPVARAHDAGQARRAAAAWGVRRMCRPGAVESRGPSRRPVPRRTAPRAGIAARTRTMPMLARWTRRRSRLQIRPAGGCGARAGRCAGGTASNRRTSPTRCRSARCRWGGWWCRSRRCGPWPTPRWSWRWRRCGPGARC